jgi:uncharacterized protein YjeT (DUF2065 family)
MWHDLWIAMALILVIEGIWPFVDPRGMRKALLMVAEQDNRTLRYTGLVAMLAGVGLLYLVN